jgi:hypothetical protein
MFQRLVSFHRFSFKWVIRNLFLRET